MNEKNSLLDLTPPVSGQPIPSGWFQRLYQTLMSLVISGDRQYTMIDRSSGGAVITLTPAAKQKLEAAAGGAPGGGSSGLFPAYPGGVTIPSVLPGVIYSADQNCYLIGWLRSSSTNSPGISIASADGNRWTYISLATTTAAEDVETFAVSLPIPANRKFYLSNMPISNAGVGAHGTTDSAVTLTEYS